MSKSPLKGLGGRSKPHLEQMKGPGGTFKSPTGGLKASSRGQTGMSMDPGTERSFGEGLVDAQRAKVPLAEGRVDRLVHGHHVGWLQIKVAPRGGVPEHRWMWVEISLGLSNNELGVGGLQECSELSLFDESQEYVKQHKVPPDARFRFELIRVWFELFPIWYLITHNQCLTHHLCLARGGPGRGDAPALRTGGRARCPLA